MSPLPEVTTWGAFELARRIADRSVSVRQVVTAYIERLQEVHRRCNVVTCERYDRALSEADAADRQMGSREWPGPLHGVPFTVKDGFDVEGLPTTLGLDRPLSPAMADAAAVARLRAAGGILLAKTNVPQLMISLGSENPVHGRTLHPFDASRTPGGSSGGEAVAVASHASALGLASDLGGSIRLPAHCCGTCALRPTSGLIETQGLRQAFPLTFPVPTVVGPLARRVEDLRLAFDVLRDPRIPFPSSDLADRPPSPRFAVWDHDPEMLTPAPIRRAVHAAAEALREHGAVQVDLPIPDLRGAVHLFLKILFADGGKRIRDLSQGSRHSPATRRILRLAGMPNGLRHLAGTASRLGQRPLEAELVTVVRQRNLSQFWSLVDDMTSLREKFLHAWRTAGVDAVISPVMPLPAVRHEDAEQLVSASGFLLLPSLLDLPTAVVPVLRVLAQDVVGGAPDVIRHRDTSPGAHGDATVRSHAVPRAPDWVQRTWQDATGLPIGVQIMADRFADHLLLTLMAQIQQSFPEAHHNQAQGTPQLRCDR